MKKRWWILIIVVIILIVIIFYLVSLMHIFPIKYNKGGHNLTSIECGILGGQVINAMLRNQGCDSQKEFLGQVTDMACSCVCCKKQPTNPNDVISEDICKDISNDSERDNCYVDLAVKTKNDSYCKLIHYIGDGRIQTPATICSTKVFVAKSNNTNEDIKTCSSILDSADISLCYKEFIKKLNNTNICYTLSGDMKSDCLYSAFGCTNEIKNYYLCQ